MNEALTLELLAQHSGLARIDVHFGRLCSETGENRTGAKKASAELVSFVAACVSRALREGHPCLPVSSLADSPIVDSEGNVTGAFPSEEELLAALSSASSVTCEPERDVAITTPLVLDSSQRIYATRYFEHEQIVSQRLADLLGEETEDSRADWLQERLAHYFRSEPGEGQDLQRLAAERALQRRFTVISGGPGTGKTSTVVKILVLLLEKARHEGSRYPVVQLMAPTGKAAARMSDAIESAVGRMGLDEEIRTQLSSTATTIHRALGVLPYSSTRYARGRERRLSADVVLVDEASMVDLGLMRHLLDALPDGARLILLGDRNQLASVEAGSVLAELGSALGEKTGDEASAMVELKKSYRFSSDSGIYALSSAVRQGDGSGAERIVSEKRDDLAYGGGLDDDSGSLRKLVLEFYGFALKQKSADGALSAMNRFRLLCAHRKGVFGVEGINEQVRRWLSDAGLLPRDGEFYRGRLILVTTNDYGVRLQNGDVGILWPDEEGHLLAYFSTVNSEGDVQLRALSPAQLPAHESAFAMTIHKSQGSEHEEVAVLLPEESSPLLTRELVYTGITRAKKRAHLFGPLSSLSAASARSVTRHSGLGNTLSALLASRTPRLRP